MYLIDTHVLIWALYDSGQLSDAVKHKINAEKCFVSIASLWEMAIKQSLGKLVLKQGIKEIAEVCESHNISIIEITPEDCDIMGKLPFVHRDPFDRIIIAQAQRREYTLITKDENIPRYGVKTIW